MAVKTERRDNSVLQALSDIRVELISIGKDLAVNTTKTGYIEDHLKTLNGKVAAHESRLQLNESSLSLQTQVLTELTTQTKEDKTFWKANKEKFAWLVLGSGFSLLVGYIATHFPR